MKMHSRRDLFSKPVLKKCNLEKNNHEQHIQTPFSKGATFQQQKYVLFSAFSTRFDGHYCQKFKLVFGWIRHKEMFSS
jgi:hypothetical protein